MRKSRFTEGQIVDILKQGEAGVPCAASIYLHLLRTADMEGWDIT